MSRRWAILSILTAVLITILVIYLTPLKWLYVTEPQPKDIDPVAFQADFTAHPDKYVFLDVRSSDVYDRLHAKGAKNEPIGNLFDDHYGLPKSGKTIVLICSSGRLAGVAYGYLEHQGFLNLLRIKGGTQGWVLEKLPVEGSNLNAPIPQVD